MTQKRLFTFAVLFLLCVFRASAAIAQSAKHKQDEAAKHAAEKAEHERKHRDEVARHAAEKAEHEKKMKAESECGSPPRGGPGRASLCRNITRPPTTGKSHRPFLDWPSVSYCADHDYDWQRHEAVDSVRGAIHDLHEHEPNTEGKFGGMTQKAIRPDPPRKHSHPAVGPLCSSRPRRWATTTN